MGCKQEQLTNPERLNSIELTHGTTVYFYDLDPPTERNPNYIAEVAQYIIQTQPDLIIPEYFSPEIRLHLLRNPFGLKLLQFIELQFPKRMQFATKVEDVSIYTGIPIATTDIANNPMSYFLHLAGEKFTPTVLSIIWGNLVSHIHPVPLQNLTYLAGETGIISYIIYDYYQTLSQKGIYDKEKVHKIEQTLLQLEDARRLITAQLILKFDTESDREQKLLVLLPTAHRLRVENYLRHPRPLKTTVYKRLLTLLQPSMKFWQYSQPGTWIIQNRMPL